MRKPQIRDWSAENCARLQQWWEVDGCTCPEIEKRFGVLGYLIGCNAIAGKVFRMKLKPPDWKAGKVRERASKTARRRLPPRQIIVRGKKYNPSRYQEVAVPAEKPDGSKNVLLKRSRSGQCKYIVGYVGGRCEDAVYCGERTETIIRNGRQTRLPWCCYHRGICTVESRGRYD
jgi:hypothetical protein